MNTIDFLENADNVYRTKHYIVKQEIDLAVNDVYDNSLVSRDTFYLRTPTRDMQYEKALKGKDNIDGKRIVAGMCTRKYVY